MATRQKTALAHIGLNCRDIAATEGFYMKHFGFQRARVVPLGQNRIVFLKSRHGYLELFQSSGETAAGGAPDGPTAPGFRHLAFRVGDVCAKLAEMGTDAVVTLGPLFFDEVIKGWGAAWIRDPDGRIVEICQGYEDEPERPSTATSADSARRAEGVSA